MDSREYNRLLEEILQNDKRNRNRKPNIIYSSDSRNKRENSSINPTNFSDLFNTDFPAFNSPESSATGNYGPVQGGSNSGFFSGTGTESGGMGATGVAAIVLAAILAQHQFSNHTNTTFEGQETDDLFGSKPSIVTDPFMGWLSDKLGLEPTQGEKVDAAVKNKDYGLALKRLPASIDLGADMGYNMAKKIFGKTGADISNPFQGLLKAFENIF